MKCPNCGADIKPGANVCLNCGYYINSDDDNETTDETFSDSFDEITDSETGSTSDKSSAKNKFFDLKGNIIYIVFGTILFFSLCLLIYGIATKKDKSTKVTPTSTPTSEVKKTAKTVEVDNYKLTVPAGLDYQVDGRSIFISNEENYNFSFRINDGDYNKYSDNVEGLSKKLIDSGYDIKDSEKKKINDKEMLIYTLSLDSDTKYLYLTEYNSEKIAMGVISIHNETSVDDACKVILNVLNSVVEMDEDSSSYNNSSSDGSSSVDDSSGMSNTTSMIGAISSLLN